MAADALLMLEGSERRTLGQYIDAITDGASPADAAKVFGDTRALDRRLEAYSRRQSVPAVVIGANQLTIGPIAIRALTPGEVAVMPARIRLRARTGGSGTAEDIAATARRAAAPFPADAGAQLVLAEAELSARRYAAAEAAADRALAIDPRSATALLHKGQARMLAAAEGSGHDAAYWRGVREIFGRAAALDRSDPRPLLAYHRSFAEAGVAATSTAKEALYLAQELAPQDVALRYRTGQVLVNEGKVAEALPLLRAVANDPHDRAAAAIARRLVAALSAQDLVGAQTILRETSQVQSQAAP